MHLLAAIVSNTLTEHVKACNTMSPPSMHLLRTEVYNPDKEVQVTATEDLLD